MMRALTQDMGFEVIGQFTYSFDTPMTPILQTHFVPNTTFLSRQACGQAVLNDKCLCPM
jgi:hypothetical protein